MDVRQFKLSTGEEIICSVLEWPDEDDYQVVVSHVFKIVAMGDSVSGARFYTFRPWLIFQEEEPNLFQIIHVEHIVGEAKPAKKLLEQYINAVKQNVESIEEKTDSYDDIIKHLMDIAAADSNPPREPDSDSNTSNVIPFSTKRTLH